MQAHSFGGDHQRLSMGLKRFTGMMMMTDPMDKDELEKLKALELASYVPPYTSAEIRELYRQALLKEPWWKRLWYTLGAADLDGRKTDGTGEDRYLPG